MTTRLAAWIVGALAVAVVLPMLASSVGGVALLLAVPVAVVASILTRRHAERHAERDVAERLVSAAATVTGERTSPDDAAVDWGAAARAELASITVPRERRRFALGSVTMLLPPVMLFSIGYLCARSTRSLRFGLETAILAALTTLVAVAVVYGVEAAHWYDIAPDVSVLDGEHVDFDSNRAAVLDAVHPIILLVHLVFWLPWPVLGAMAGARAPRAATS
jgi:Na+/H+-dicarboxylate symporter